MRSSSAGYDNIPISVFKHNFDIIGPLVKEICNGSLTSGIFPSSLRTDRSDAFSRRVVDVTLKFKGLY